MRNITFVVPGEPVGKARPRVVGGHAYTPEKTRVYERAVRLAYKQATKGRPDAMIPKGTPVELSIIAIYQLPRTKHARQEALRQKVPMKKPDIDNVIKLVQDALNGLAYEDDAQIVKIRAVKYWEDHVVDGEMQPPCCMVYVGEYDVHDDW